MGRNYDSARARFGQSNATNRARVDDSRTVCTNGSPDDVLCPVDVGRKHRGIVGHPKGVACGDMEAPVASLHRAGQSLRRIRDVALSGFVVGTGESLQVCSRP